MSYQGTERRDRRIDEKNTCYWYAARVGQVSLSIRKLPISKEFSMFTKATTEATGLLPQGIWFISDLTQPSCTRRGLQSNTSSTLSNSVRTLTSQFWTKCPWNQKTRDSIRWLTPYLGFHSEAAGFASRLPLRLAT